MLVTENRMNMRMSGLFIFNILCYILDIEVCTCHKYRSISCFLFLDKKIYKMLVTENRVNMRMSGLFIFNILCYILDMSNVSVTNIPQLAGIFWKVTLLSSFILHQL